MKPLSYLILFVLQLSTFGTPAILQYKILQCALWDSPCLTSKAQANVPQLIPGNPELGIEPLDPMYIDSMHFDEDEIRGDFDHLYVYGYRNTIIDNVSVDMTNKLIRLMFHTDLLLKAHYALEGTLLSSHIEGDGEMTASLKNVHFEFVMPFDIIKDIHGNDIMDYKGYQYWFDVRGVADINFENLYYGNKELSQKMHALIKQNSKSLTMRFGRYLYDKTNDKIFNAMRRFMHSRPLDVTFY